VLDLLSQGLTTRQIAQRLVVSPITVRTHANSILSKLQIDDRAELVRQFGTRP
jgi:DNA-binding NarL/FixJ family response regulator